jgi:putative endonuclease
VTVERIRLGKTGEKIALKRLKKLGYKYIEKNYRCSMGEIDLIMKHKEHLIFVEIKTRKGYSTAYAKEAIDKRKIRKISKTALNYMKENDCCDVKSRFDVVAINLDRGNEEIEVITDAFELDYG